MQCEQYEERGCCWCCCC